jgi:oligopeptide/dipeptide ABC transporter ATP-binding protein
MKGRRVETFTAEPYMRLEAVSKHYPIRAFPWARRHRVIHALDGVSLSVAAGETLALVGESGSGKSTTAKLVLGLEQPTSGRVFFKERSLPSLSKREFREYRVSVQAVFQDSGGSLNPRMRVSDIVAEPLQINRKLGRDHLKETVDAMLLRVGLDPSLGRGYAHEFSGGQRQRIAIARALVLEPRLVVLDEPLSSLDVSTSAQVLNLLSRLQQQLQVTYLFVAHDLASVRHLSHRMAVMYLGEVVEWAPTESLFAAPLHPYTQALLSSSTDQAPGEALQLVLDAEVPSPADPPPGCRFHTRCPHAFDLCTTVKPEPLLIGPEHSVSCHLYSSSEGAGGTAGRVGGAQP